MKKETGKFKQVPETVHVCDFCDGELPIKITYDYKWSDGYDYYGDEVEFCSLECFGYWLSDPDKEEHIFPQDEVISIYANSGEMKRLLAPYMKRRS